MSNVELLNVAVTGEDARVTFFESGDRDSWGSSLHRSHSLQNPIEVAGRRLDGILRDADVDRVDLLKIDIEGAEYEVLSSFAGLEQVDTIVGDVHPYLMDCTLSDFRRLLEGFAHDLPVEAGAHQPFSARRLQPT